MLAYHQISHNTSGSELVRPVTYTDLLRLLLVSRGIDPDMVAADRAAPSPAPKGRPQPLTVHGGRETEQHRRVAEQWHAANMPKDWAKRTGSSPAAIAWALDPEA